MFQIYLDTSLSLVCYVLEIADNECHKICTHFYALLKVVCTQLYCIITLKQKFKQRNCYYQKQDSWGNAIQGRVVRKPVNANPGLKVNQSRNLSSIKMFFTSYVFTSSQLKGKQYKQKKSPKSYKTEIKILANPGLA